MIRKEMIPIAHKTKSDFVYDAIKGKIVSKAYAPGTHLVVADLAKELNVSPMPIREALIRLSNESYVQIIPHVGASIVGVNPAKLHEAHQLRIELESFASTLLAPIITDHQLSVLDSMVEEGNSLIDCTDIHDYYDWNQRFHFAIAEMNPNRLLEEYIRSLWDRLRFEARRSGIQTWRNKASMAEHRLWVDSLRTRDSVIASAACRKHCSAVDEFNLYSIHDNSEA